MVGDLPILTTFGWNGGSGEHTRLAWVTSGHDCLCSCACGRGAAVRSQTKDSIFDGVISLWCSVAPFLSCWCTRGEVPSGVNLNQYSGSDSCIPWHSDNESLFGPHNQPKLIVCMSLGHSVEFQVRCAPCGVPSPIQLHHGDSLGYARARLSVSIQVWTWSSSQTTN